MNKKYLKAMIKEPYVHFFLIGIVLYMIYITINPNSNLPKKKSILITQEQIEDINSTLHKRWHHKISFAELNLTIQDHYYDEIMLNESIAFEIYKRDKMVRERLIKKMKHIIASVTPKEPTEAQLHKYYEDHTEDYGQIKNISFYHIYFSNIKENEAKHFVKLLNRYHVDPSKASQFGDDFDGRHHIKSATIDELSSKFGKYFSKQLRDTISHRWQGGIRSKDGTHIVYIVSKELSANLPFDEVEDRVYRDYMRSVTDKSKDEAYKKLSTQYQLVN